MAKQKTPGGWILQIPLVEMVGEIYCYGCYSVDVGNFFLFGGGGNLICPWDDSEKSKLKQFLSRLFHIETLRSPTEMHVENPFQLFQS